MSLISRKIAAFAKKVASLSPKPGGTMPVADLQAQFDAAPEELRAALNGAIDDIIADYATKAELSGIQLGQITDGTVTPVKLSFDPATQAELDAHTSANTAHGAVSTATANAMVVRDANGRAQFASPAAAVDAVNKGYVDSIKPVSGAYTGDGAASRDIALPFTPSAVYLNPKVDGPSAGSARSGLALNGSPLTTSAPSTYLLIGTNKFTVYYDGTSTFSNSNTIVYHYIAFP